MHSGGQFYTVADEAGNLISLANNTNIVDYDLIQANGQPVLATNKGLIDLVNADPLIGNFNSFTNIQNALTKDAVDGFLTNPLQSALGAAADKVWSSPNEIGAAFNEASVTYNTNGGNDALYERNNAALSTDSLGGGAGNDMIEGRDGNDVMNGGTGGAANADDFIVRLGDFDRITDYNHAEGDQIWIWYENLDSIGAGSPPAVRYTVCQWITPVAELVGSPDIGTNSSNDVFIT